ncbi:DUF6279 family lipoprotein [Neptunicella sp. SCSIO 80796]|uniref:DUF6279 family lipoprotein n=1 Tax=Neptunicella plasticusilytica TaxID=3117012 RepID=UPI003A4E54EA
MLRKCPLWIIGLLLLLSGCSSKFAYNNLDWLVYWYVDDYIELTRSQKKTVDAKLQGWLQWHRKDELQRYQQQLITIREQHRDGALDFDQWLGHFEQGRQHWYRFRDKLAPDLVELAPMLTDQQINEMFDELEKENAEQQEQRANKTQQELAEQRFEEIVENFEEFVGNLSTAQEQVIKQALPEFQSAFESWLAYRRAWQSAAREMLINQRNTAGFSTSFLHLITNPQEFQAQQFITLVEQNRMVYARLVADIDQSLSAKQRSKMDHELTDLIDDLGDLIDSD